MSADGHARIEPLTDVAPTSGQDKFGSWYMRLYLTVFVAGIAFVFANPGTNVYTEWWAAWGVPGAFTLLSAIAPWRWTWESPPKQLTFKRAEPIELGPISERIVGILAGLVMGALIGFMAHEVLQVAGAAFPGRSHEISADVMSFDKGGTKDRCNQHATFRFSNDATQEICVHHAWRADVTDEKLDVGESVRMTLKDNAIGKWVIAINKE